MKSLKLSYSYLSVIAMTGHVFGNMQPLHNQHDKNEGVCICTPVVSTDQKKKPIKKTSDALTKERNL